MGSTDARVQGRRTLRQSMRCFAIAAEMADPALDCSPLLLNGTATSGRMSAILWSASMVPARRLQGKIRLFTKETVVLGAADTFRAAAADQLETWGSRKHVPAIRSSQGLRDPASVAFDVAQKAQETVVQMCYY